MYILVGSEYKDNAINLMAFFTATAYSGFGDDSKVVKPLGMHEACMTTCTINTDC